MALSTSHTESSEGKIKHTTCYMCACRCGIEVHLNDNKIRFIKGNPRHPVNKGVLCAKGNAGIMKQESPAKLTTPLRRKQNCERGSGEFEAISWDEALDHLTQRLRKLRATDPNKFAFFSGRDQMQALSGLWAQQFGTLNWAAHGGLCSVNMAAAGLYTLGHSFWEFGEPDWERTQYFVLWGVAEDHSSNPLKLGLQKLKQRGGKFVAINPVRTGYQAIADEWVPIKPGTDAALILSMIHVLLKHEQFDWEFLSRYSNAPQLVIDAPGTHKHGLILRDAAGNPMVYDLLKQQICSANDHELDPALIGRYQTTEGVSTQPAFDLLLQRYSGAEYAPENAAKICGVPAATIEKLALEMAHVAFQQAITLDIPWTDAHGRQHAKTTGRPVSMHAMRGISAHSNGFQTCRALHLLQMLLGSIDVPGGHRAKPPYPKHTPPPIKPARQAAPNQPLSAPPLGFPLRPEDLAIDADGQARRLDKAYSWEAPLAAHGLMQMAITNAVAGDPYPIDTLLLFMANMSWNSTMNTQKIQELLRERDANGEYKLPFLVVVDSFDSEIVRYADLVLPDTTYLERFDTISILDRPISDPDLVCDAIRAPVVEPDRDVRAWQEVLIELAKRLQLPLFTDSDGKPRYENYQDFIVNFQKEPGIGFLAGWRGNDGEQDLRGAPNQHQWQRYIENECFFSYEIPESQRFYRFCNRDYLKFAKRVGFINSDEPITLQLYLETLQHFRLAGAGLYDGPCPTSPQHQARLQKFFDPLPFYYQNLEQQATDEKKFPFFAITQRPMPMYHSWDSQNAWLRQICAQNFLYMNRARATELGIKDLSWVWLSSTTAKIRAQVKLMEGVQSDTVWTWNAIGKQPGRWGLNENANEANEGFLLNHLISELLPPDAQGQELANADPITGQAAWYDLRISITPADAPPLNKASIPDEILSYHSGAKTNFTHRIGD